MFVTKDFIETAENLIFAVVADGIEQGKVLCFLRYVREHSGLKKYDTAAANQFLQQNYPQYLSYSSRLDTAIHAVSTENISQHYQPKPRLQAILRMNQPDSVQTDLIALCEKLQTQGIDSQQLGITGSLLIGAQQEASSDVDLVCYQSSVFQQIRYAIKQLIEQKQLDALNEQDWQASFQRRACALSLSEYIWHEQRKLNKAIIHGRKFDLSLVTAQSDLEYYQKCGAMTLQAHVIDDSKAFAYPAEFMIDHAEIATVVSFTATYAGQATQGEMIEVAGLIEQNSHGVKRLVIGSSREAIGEYIKVISC